MTTKRLITAILLGAAFAALGSGCAGIFEFKVPREFDGKKKVEDPPKTWHKTVPTEATA